MFFRAISPKIALAWGPTYIWCHGGIVSPPVGAEGLIQWLQASDSSFGMTWNLAKKGNLEKEINYV